MSCPEEVQRFLKVSRSDDRLAKLSAHKLPVAFSDGRAIVARRAIVVYRTFESETQMLFMKPRKRTSRGSSLKSRMLLLIAISIFSRPASGIEHVEVTRHDEFEVVIAGGSTAAFAAAIASAKSGAKTALLEPTDWVGGQLTASAVPAIDEAWHKISDPDSGEVLLNVAQWARTPQNMTPNFLQTLRGMQDCGDCWVSRFCFRPKVYLETQLLPLQRAAGDNLIVFLDTVVKQVEVDSAGQRMIAITAIQREPKIGNGYDRLPSQDLADWYSADESDRFRKSVLRFGAKGDKPPVFVEATEWGEVLALSGADYLQGTEDVEGEPGGEDTCGQSIVYDFIQELHPDRVAQTDPPGDPTRLGLGDYQDKPNAWPLIWTYRRVRGEGEPAPGDLCLQNWGYSDQRGQGGNDYPFGYLFKSKAEAAQETSDWQGGVDLSVLAGAEQRAYGWHHWFRKHAPEPLHPDQFTLAGTMNLAPSMDWQSCPTFATHDARLGSTVLF